jgi:hypothetical protein
VPVRAIEENDLTALTDGPARLCLDLVKPHVFGVAGGLMMRSFLKHEFRQSDLGYYNVVTHELVFPHGAISAPANTW